MLIDAFYCGIALLKRTAGIARSSLEIIRLVPWCWLEMVAQLTDDSIDTVVHGLDGKGSSLVACYFRTRENSYDHKRCNALIKSGAFRGSPLMRLPIWDFVLERDDKTGIRLHPQ